MVHRKKVISLLLFAIGLIAIFGIAWYILRNKSTLFQPKIDLSQPVEGIQIIDEHPGFKVQKNPLIRDDRQIIDALQKALAESDTDVPVPTIGGIRITVTDQPQKVTYNWVEGSERTPYTGFTYSFVEPDQIDIKVFLEKEAFHEIDKTTNSVARNAELMIYSATMSSFFTNFNERAISFFKVMTSITNTNLILVSYE